MSFEKAFKIIQSHWEYAETDAVCFTQVRLFWKRKMLIDFKLIELFVSILFWSVLSTAIAIKLYFYA